MKANKCLIIFHVAVYIAEPQARCLQNPKYDMFLAISAFLYAYEVHSAIVR